MILSRIRPTVRYCLRQRSQICFYLLKVLLPGLPTLSPSCPLGSSPSLDVDVVVLTEDFAPTLGIQLPPPNPPPGLDPVQFFLAMYLPPRGSIAIFRVFPRYYTRFSPAELVAYFPHQQARGGVTTDSSSITAPPALTLANPNPQEEN
jgi:hypothetical protein